MRLLAKRMREKADEMEEAKVDVRREDKTIREFTIPTQPDLPIEVINITSFNVIKNHKPKKQKVALRLKKNQHLRNQSRFYPINGWSS